MIVSCPACSTRFVVDSALLGAEGRRVRCAKCAHVWHQMPDSESEADLTAADRFKATPLPPDAPASHEASPESGRKFDRGWILFGAVLVLLVAGVVLGQRQIVAAWPPAERLYRAMGMASPQAGEGLVIRDILPEPRMQDGERSVIVSGEVVNPSDSAVDLPALRVTLVDDQGNVLSSVQTGLGRPRLGAGESASFAVEFTEPAPEAARVNVAFDPPGRRQ